MRCLSGTINSMFRELTFHQLEKRKAKLGQEGVVRRFNVVKDKILDFRH